MEFGDLIQLLLALGVGTILPGLVNNVIDWAKGRKAEERNCWDYADDQARRRRLYQEFALETRMAAMRSGVPEDVLPDWPDV